MKQVKFLLLAAFVTMFTGCQNEEIMEQDSEKDKPVPTGDTRIIIEGEGMLETSTRSSDGRVDFTGGYATGAGLYDGRKNVPVEVHPDAGYEVNYFYGGPANQPKKYDYAQSGVSEFDVDLGGQDHTFHCGFKEKKRTLTINAGEGGTTAPKGTKEYQVEKPITIMATPKSGYEFTGWTVIDGDVTIENPDSSTTTATLHGSNSTITANFKQPIRSITINLDRFYSSTSSINGGRSYEYLTVSSTDCSGIICKIYGQTKNDMDNMDEVGYPVRIEQNQKVMYAYLEWETVTQDGDTREKSVTPQSFDIIIDNVMVLSNIKSPSGKQSLDFGEFDGKEITGIGYRMTFQFTSHWE